MPAARSLRGIAALAGALFVGVAACGTNGNPPPATDTWAVDCVAVLGMPPPAPPTVLNSVPLSGVARDKRIGDLTDDEAGRFCDYEVCLGSSGYRHECCDDHSCPNTVPGDPPIGPFRLETASLIMDAVETCYQTPYGTSGEPSREDCMQVLRGQFGACHVGPWEDCARELVTSPLGGSGRGKDCAEKDHLCVPL